MDTDFYWMTKIASLTGAVAGFFGVSESVFIGGVLGLVSVIIGAFSLYRDCRDYRLRRREIEMQTRILKELALYVRNGMSEERQVSGQTEEVPRRRRSAKG